jgi:hypothetical protein
VLGSHLHKAKVRIDHRLPPWRFPLAMFNHSYQDGFADALDHTIAARRSGEDRRHHYLQQKARGYDQARQKATAKRDYWNAAFIEGYWNGLVALGMAVRPNDVPMYYCPGIGPERSFVEVERAIRAGRRTHATAFAWAAREIRKLPEGVSFNHPPVLPDYSE